MSKYKIAIVFLVLHALLVIVWNIVGVWLISQGKSALGPTATLVGALVFAVIISVYILLYKKAMEIGFLITAILGASMGIFAVYGALTKDPNLWPSEFWRFAGIAVNTLGILGLIFALKAFFKK
ncbi:MAG: hypothetical protein KAG37_03795 [Flavobacteriales bacterium]|nr:hypothetical protein [Flavobacteriales bacterium]